MRLLCTRQGLVLILPPQDFAAVEPSVDVQCLAFGSYSECGEPSWLAQPAILPVPLCLGHLSCLSDLLILPCMLAFLRVLCPVPEMLFPLLLSLSSRIELSCITLLTPGS